MDIYLHPTNSTTGCYHNTLINNLLLKPEGQRHTAVLSQVLQWEWVFIRACLDSNKTLVNVNRNANWAHFILNIKAQKPVLFETKKEQSDAKSPTHLQISMQSPEPAWQLFDRSNYSSKFPRPPKNTSRMV